MPDWHYQRIRRPSFPGPADQIAPGPGVEPGQAIGGFALDARGLMAWAVAAG
jgi:hypothetical protein